MSPGPVQEVGAAAWEVHSLLLRSLLLAWWQEHGRHTIPWKRRPDGHPPADGEPLDPFPIWCAEVMRAARQHSCSTAGWP